MQPTTLLSDEFVEFSSKITALHTKKKDLKAELQRVIDQFKAEIAEIDKQAVEANVEFESWKTKKETKAS